MRKSTGKGANVTPPEDSDDPAEAFNALRKALDRYGADTTAEMTVIRRSVETALDRYESMAQPIDYSSDLGNLIQQTASVDMRLAKIEAAEMWKFEPRDYAGAMAKVAEASKAALIAQVVEKIGDSQRESDNLRSEMRSTLQGVRDRRRQNLILCSVLAGGMILGMLAFPVIIRLQGEGTNGLFTALFMGKDRWDAGQTMMQSFDPAAWQKWVAARDVLGNNGAIIEKCQAAAAKTGRGQKCLVTVRPPDR